MKIRLFDRARGHLLTSAACGVVAFAGTATAQVTTSPGPAVQSEAPTSAQTSPAVSDASVDSGDIVVTGTLLRGVATPTGSNLLRVDAAQIQSTGSTAAIDVLNQTVPQLPTLNSVSAGSAGFGTPVAKIGLRGIGNTNGSASGQTATLVLFNGHRIVPVGVLSTDPDPNLIPADALESVQVLPDGGSSTYGSDAIGGVVNFMAKKRFDGVQLNYQHRFADNYNEDNISVLAGTHWSTGSILISGNYNRHGAILGRDRDYITSDFTSHGGQDYRQTACGYGNFAVNGTSYVAPGFQPVSVLPRCDATDYTSLTPRERRGNIFIYAEQEITPSLKFSVDGIYSVRTDKIYTDVGNVPVTLTIDGSNPFFRPVAGETSQTVSFNYSRGIGPARISPQRFEQYQIDPSLSWTINDDWQVKADFLHGKSFATIHDRTGLNGSAVNSTNVNPYDTAQTDPAVLRNLTNYELYTRGVNTLTSGQIVANGTLFSLPGGDVKVAFGGEIRRQSLDNSTVTGAIGDRTGLQRFDAARTIKAVFGEVLVPLVGEGNAMPFVQSLTVNASVRYDHYSDFGGTTNPRVGIDWRPTRDLVLRGSYQTTFVAPSLADSGNKIDTRFQVLTIAPSNYLVFIAGAGENLKPQTGRSFSIGGDFTPEAIRGLKIGATYWNTKIDNLVSLSLAAYGFPGALGTNFALCGSGGFGGVFPASPNGPCTAAYLNSIQPIWNRIDNGGAPAINSIADLFTPGTNIISVVDARRANFGTEKIDGIDMDVAYTTDVSFGTIFAQAAATYYLHKKIAAAPGAPYLNYLSGAAVYGATPRYNVVAAAGAKIGDLTGRVTVRRNGGFDIPVGTSVGQTHVSGYTVTDLSFDYALGSVSLLKNASLSITIQNLFDKDPPYFGGRPQVNTVAGFTNGGTLGRLVSLGIRSSF